MDSFFIFLKEYLSLLIAFVSLVVWVAAIRSSTSQNTKDIKALFEEVKSMKEAEVTANACGINMNNCQALNQEKMAHINEKWESLEKLMKENKREYAESLTAMETRIVSALAKTKADNDDDREQILRSVGNLVDELRATRIDSNRKL